MRFRRLEGVGRSYVRILVCAEISAMLSQESVQDVFTCLFFVLFFLFQIRDFRSDYFTMIGDRRGSSHEIEQQKRGYFFLLVQGVLLDFLSGRGGGY